MFNNSRYPFGLSEAERKTFCDQINCSAGGERRYEQIRKCGRRYEYRPPFTRMGGANRCEKMRERFRSSGCVPPCFASGK